MRLAWDLHDSILNQLAVLLTSQRMAAMYLAASWGVQPEPSSKAMNAAREEFGQAQEVLRRIGALPDSHGLYPRLTARENVRIAAQARARGLDVRVVAPLYAGFDWY